LNALAERSGVALQAAPSDGQASGAAAAKRQRETGVLWKLTPAKAIEPVQVKIGITDHAYTEVVAVTKGSLDTNDAVVTAAVVAKGSAGLGALR
jgi:hypothetical protein